jgi:serine/threonine protein kinase
MKLTTFNIQDKKSQSFLTMRYSNECSSKNIHDIIIDHAASLVGITSKNELVVKFIKARSWHEYVKLLWNHSRVTKEVKGNEILSSLGLRVPRIHEAGYGIIPSKKHRFIGYYIMENLKKSGFQELSTIINSNNVSNSLRSKIMHSIYDGLKSMRDNRIIFSDFHFENIFSNSKGEVVWIDTGVSVYNKLNDKKFVKKFNHSVTRYGSGNKLSNEEIIMFNSLLIQSN